MAKEAASAIISATDMLICSTPGAVAVRPDCMEKL